MRTTPPSTSWYRLSWALVVLGLVAAGVWWPYSSSRVFDAVEAFTRAGPSGGPVDLATAGTHTLWVEGSCLSCHDNNPSEYRQAAEVAVTTEAGRPIALRAAPPRIFNTARREGRAIWLFDAPVPGTYVIELDFDTSGDWDNVVPSNIAVSAGTGLPVGIVRPMVAFAGGGTAAALAIAAVTAIRRRRFYVAYDRASGR